MDSEALRRLRLRVLAKLGFAALLLGLGWVLVAGIPGPAPPPRPAPLSIDTRDIPPDTARRYLQGGRSVLVLHRSQRLQRPLPGLAERLLDPASDRSAQPAFARNPHRSADPRWLVILASAVESGCPVDYLPPSPERFRGAPWPGGFRDACSHSRFDAAGRVYLGQGAQRNLTVPDYRHDGVRLELR